MSARTAALEGEVTIYRATELKETVLSLLNGATDVEIDLSKVTELDSAGVQILMLAKQVAAGKGCTLRLVGHSPAVLEVLELFDLAAHFGDPLLVPSA